MTTQNETQEVAEHFKTVNGCSVANVTDGRIELTVTCMNNCPNALPGGRKSATVLTDTFGYTYNVEYTDDETCVITA